MSRALGISAQFGGRAVGRGPARSEPHADADDGALSNAVGPLLHRQSLLMFQNLKALDVINMSVAVAALLLSGWVFAHQLNQEHTAAVQAQNRMLFGSYTLARDYEHLLLCAKLPSTLTCEHPTRLADFAKLNPLARVVLENSVDWRTLETRDQYESPANNGDELSPGNLANAAMSAQYDDRRVAATFLLGQEVEYLIGSSRNPSISSADRQKNILIAKSIDARLSELGGLCQKFVLPTDSAPELSSVLNLHGCLVGLWLPEN
jgi:hypothetical protein